MIENSAQEHTHSDKKKLNAEEAVIESGLVSTFASVLQQCSTPIYMVNSRKLGCCPFHKIRWVSR